MADVDIIPKICCDNCGLTVTKNQQGNGASRSFHKPRTWGSLSIEGGRATDSYGGKDKMSLPDLCEECANAAVDAAAEALAKLRGERP